MEITLTDRTRERLQRAGGEFLVEFMRAETKRRPSNVDALAELAHTLTRLGRVDEGLEIDRQLVRLLPDNATVHYNLGCSLALLQRPDDALDALEEAVRQGYRDVEHLLADEDLGSLHHELRFQELLERLRRLALT